MSFSAIEPIYRLYLALARTQPLDSDYGLGGKLLYAGRIDGQTAGRIDGRIDQQSRLLLYAANVAGAASLAASADPAILRQAMRDGVIDFAVTSLEEALRILKNEVRKRQPVSVGVGCDPEKLVAQMLDRGVLPDLVPDFLLAGIGSESASVQKFLTQGARAVAAPIVSATPDATENSFVLWSVADGLVGGFARWLPRLDACAQAAIPAEDHFRQRWLRLAPRSLGRLAQRHHGVALTTAEAARFRTGVEAMLRSDAPAGSPAPAVTIQTPAGIEILGA